MCLPEKTPAASQTSAPAPTATPEQAGPTAQPQRHPATLLQRAQAKPELLTQREQLHLQKTLGNHALGQALRGVGGQPVIQAQKKLGAAPTPPPQATAPPQPKPKLAARPGVIQCKYENHAAYKKLQNYFIRFRVAPEYVQINEELLKTLEIDLATRHLPDIVQEFRTDYEHLYYPALQRGLQHFQAPNPQNPTIVQKGYMTGDMFAIGLSTQADAARRILLIDRYDNQRPGSISSALSILQYYRELGILEQVDYVPYSSQETEGWGEWFQAQEQAIDQMKRGKGSYRENAYLGPGAATRYVGENFGRMHPDEDLQEKNRAAHQLLLGHVPQDFDADALEVLAMIAAERGAAVPPPGYPLAFLWNRQSGKKRDAAHPEHDSSQTYLQIAAQRLRQLGYYVVLLGDTPQKKAVSGSVNLDLTEFWNSRAFAHLADSYEKPRLTQLRFLEALYKLSGGQAVHVGSRSGALEPLALLGIPVIYIEEENNPEAERMAEWQHYGLPYFQFQTEWLPTRTGQIQQIAHTLQGYPKYEKERGLYIQPFDEALSQNGFLSAINNLLLAMRKRKLDEIRNNLKLLQLMFEFQNQKRQWQSQLTFPPNKTISKHPSFNVKLNQLEELQKWQLMAELIYSKILTSGMLADPQQPEEKWARVARLALKKNLQGTKLVDNDYMPEQIHQLLGQLFAWIKYLVPIQGPPEASLGSPLNSELVEDEPGMEVEPQDATGPCIGYETGTQAGEHYWATHWVQFPVSGSGNLCLLRTLVHLLGSQGIPVSLYDLHTHLLAIQAIQPGEMIDVYNPHILQHLAATYHVQFQVHEDQGLFNVVDHPVIGNAGRVLHIYHQGLHFTPIYKRL